MKFMKDASVEEILAKTEYWGQDLRDMLPEVTKWYEMIKNDGMGKAYDAVLS